MSDDKLHILIAGAGIAGLTLAIMLEKIPNVRYTILERAHEFKALGSSIVLSPQVLRVYDQLGILEEMRARSSAFMATVYLRKDFSVIGQGSTKPCEERFGYHMRVFSRPDLMDILLSHVPAEKVRFGKRVLSLSQNQEGVMVRCTDGTTMHGDILVGADGAYSAVRQSMFEAMKKKGTNVPEADLSSLRFEQFSILGTTSRIDHLYQLPRKGCTMYNVMPTNEHDIYVYVLDFDDGRLGWRLSGPSLTKYAKDEANFRLSDWDSESIDGLKNQLVDAPAPIVGTIGQLFEHTQSISRIMLEDKFYETWHHGRTVLIGDACHKVIPAAGQGANQSILDCICLANLIAELPSSKADDVEKVFRKYYDLRAPIAEKAVKTSKTLGKLICTHSFFGIILRTIFIKLMGIMAARSMDTLYSGRPILNYLPHLPLKGFVPDSSLPMTLGLPHSNGNGKNGEATAI
ncbi:hypothetical protein DFQ27_002752 [Actinomortierella ambigua]|uniref:FAD-binding domain-containing protein n=1 Tax=Actinomortierella ambigua TaxID=1343610 RepID=A0A9P6Q9J5_9FUNG|nr:hypothetical protein DFQ27_002752 [Actinomortierella ambigua]